MWRGFIFWTVVVAAGFVEMQSLGQNPRDISVKVLTKAERSKNKIDHLEYCTVAVQMDTGNIIPKAHVSPWRCDYIQEGEQGYVQKVEDNKIGMDGILRKNIKYYYRSTN